MNKNIFGILLIGLVSFIFTGANNVFANTYTSEIYKSFEKCDLDRETNNKLFPDFYRSECVVGEGKQSYFYKICETNYCTTLEKTSPEKQISKNINTSESNNVLDDKILEQVDKIGIRLENKFQKMTHAQMDKWSDNFISATDILSEKTKSVKNKALIDVIQEEVIIRIEKQKSEDNKCSEEYSLSCKNLEGIDLSEIKPIKPIGYIDLPVDVDKYIDSKKTDESNSSNNLGTGSYVVETKPGQIKPIDPIGYIDPPVIVDKYLEKPDINKSDSAYNKTKSYSYTGSENPIQIKPIDPIGYIDLPVDVDKNQEEKTIENKKKPSEIYRIIQIKNNINKFPNELKKDSLTSIEKIEKSNDREKLRKSTLDFYKFLLLNNTDNQNTFIDESLKKLEELVLEGNKITGSEKSYFMFSLLGIPKDIECISINKINNTNCYDYIIQSLYEIQINKNPKNSIILQQKIIKIIEKSNSISIKNKDMLINAISRKELDDKTIINENPPQIDKYIAPPITN